ncbi:MAG: DMT family transporter [Desulfobacter sp.]|nr:MAG: DMT family transporter [Desulfobacter sp.]
MKILLLMLAFAAGMLAPLQAGMNTRMGRAIGDPFYAALISFAVGTMGLLVYGLVCRMEFNAIREISHVHWTLWFAGLLGAFYVTATIILTPKLGSTLTFCLVVAGQLVMALILDHFGSFGIPVQPFNWPRLLGVALITAGVLLIRKF